MTNWYPPPSKPRPVENGIRARSKRGRIAQTWWSSRFIEVLEALGVGGRLQRGRSYARKGQVIDLAIDAGAVTALVQGSRTRPYRVRLGITAYDKTEWSRVAHALAGNAWYVARLLNAEMPEDIEEVFASVDLALFPRDAGELSMDCSCPDWSVPCKHLAAVCYLLAESFDEDPFGILAWRGRERAELLDTLAALRTDTHPADRSESSGGAVPLADCLGSFYASPAEIPLRAHDPAAPGALLKQLPLIAASLRGSTLTELLIPAYRRLQDPGEEPAGDELTATD